MKGSVYKNLVGKVGSIVVVLENIGFIYKPAKRLCRDIYLLAVASMIRLGLIQSDVTYLYGRGGCESSVSFV